MTPTVDNSLGAGLSDRNAWNLRILLVIVVLGSFLRVLDLGEQPIFGDEAFSVWFATRSWDYLWTVVPGIELHPSFYYSILKVALAFGHDEWILRLPSALFSIAILPVVYIAGRSIGGDEGGPAVGLIAALICAVSVFQIDRAQVGRSYAIWMFAFALSLSALAWLVRNPTAATLPLRSWIRTSKPLAAFVCLSVGLSLLMWLHNLGAVFAASIALFCVIWWIVYLEADARAFWNLFLVAVVAVLLYAPNIPILLEQTARAEGAELYQSVPPGPRTLLFRITNAVGVLAHIPLRLRFALALNVPLLIVAVAGTVALLRRDRGAFALLLLTLALGPLALTILVTYTMKPILEAPSLGPISIPWFLLLACAALLFREWRMRAAIAGGVCLIYAAALPGYYTDPYRQEPWDRIVRIMSKESTGSGTVIAVPNGVALPLDYYVEKQRAKLDIVPLPGAYPARGLPPFQTPLGNGIAAIDDHAIEALRRTMAARNPEWLVVKAMAWFDPDGRVKDELGRRFCLTRYDLEIYSYIEIFRLSRRAPGTPETCAASRAVRAPVCSELMTRIARSPVGCIGNAPDVAYCGALTCRLERR